MEEDVDEEAPKMTVIDDDDSSIEGMEEHTEKTEGVCACVVIAVIADDDDVTELLLL